MPKMKSHRGAAKRFRKTGSGRVKRARAFTSHMFSHKSQKQKRNLRKPALVSKSDYKRIKTLLPKK